MAALTTAEEDALRQALGAMDNYRTSQIAIRRAAEKTLGVAEGSLDRHLVRDFCQAERVKAPPSLAFGDKGLVVTFMPPSDVSHAALYLHVDGDKLFYDGDKKKLLAPGELGNALAARPRRPNKIVVDGRLKGGKPITATVCYRGPAAFAFSPEAPTATPSSPLCLWCPARRWCSPTRRVVLKSTSWLRRAASRSPFEWSILRLAMSIGSNGMQIKTCTIACWD